MLNTLMQVWHDPSQQKEPGHLHVLCQPHRLACSPCLTHPPHLRPQAFSLPEAAGAVAEGPLRSLVATMLCKLLDERIAALPDGGQQLLKALNVLMLKILDLSDRRARPLCMNEHAIMSHTQLEYAGCARRTRTLCALLLLLRCPPASISAGSDDVQFKFADLVVKCLIKLTKALQMSLSVRMPHPFLAVICLHASGFGWATRVRSGLIT